MPQPKDKDWLNGYKSKTPIYAVYIYTHLKTRDTYRLKVKGWKKYFTQMETKRKQESQHSYQAKYFKGYEKRQGHSIMIKGSIQEEDIAFINIYASNIGAPQHVRQTLTSERGS